MQEEGEETEVMWNLASLGASLGSVLNQGTNRPSRNWGRGFSQFRPQNQGGYQNYRQPQYRQPQYSQPQQYLQRYEPQMRYQRPMGYYQSRYQPQYGGNPYSGYQQQYGQSMYGGMNPRYQNRLSAMGNIQGYDQGRRNQYSRAAAQNRFMQDYYKTRPQQATGGGGGGRKDDVKNFLMPGRRILKKLF